MDFALTDDLRGMLCLLKALALNLKWVDELISKEGDGATSLFRGDTVCVPGWVGVRVRVT